MLLCTFLVHILGFIADASMAIRIYYENKWFGYAALGLEGIYCVLYVIWLIWVQTLRFRKSGRICSGAYLDSDEVTDMYAVKQGKVLLGIIIGVYVANITITILAIVAGKIASG